MDEAVHRYVRTVSGFSFECGEPLAILVGWRYFLWPVEIRQAGSSWGLFLSVAELGCFIYILQSINNCNILNALHQILPDVIPFSLAPSTLCISL